ncbi:MAG: 2-amino-4-hydroxy-6-hydroxymethyldihydropteridine diphosphokinase [Lachnospiraceae bacterium]|nr:2-amino-4-hydroxy-6-hydroxymethyldihydropteridine diphosphokinase [Lachnospiraceae bacterium]
MDSIFIDGLRIYAYHGVFEEEKKEGQLFLVSARLFGDLQEAGKTDDLTKSTHYGEVSELIEELFTKKSYDLIETVAEKCASGILKKSPHVREVELTVFKPEAPISVPFENVSVTVTRKWHTAYIAYGSNMGDKEKYIDEALVKLSNHDEIKEIKDSKRYVTKPYGGVVQDDFLNGMVRIKTLLTPQELLELLHELEKEANRERTIHWGPRTLDLDIIFYDDLVLETDELTIPHVDMHNRDFVLKPLNDLTHFYVHPVLKRSAMELLADLENK